MPLHHSTRKSAVSKYGQLANAPEDLRKALQADNNNYTEDEIKEIVEAILAPSTSSAASSAPIPKVKGPNADIAGKLSKFNYDELRGNDFLEYCQLVQSLQLDKLHDFVQYQVEPIRKVRFKGVKDSPVDVIGVRIVNNKAINTTRVPVKFALQTNGIVKKDPDDDFFETVNAQFTHNGRYFFLKK